MILLFTTLVFVSGIVTHAFDRFARANFYFEKETPTWMFYLVSLIVWGGIFAISAR